MPSRISLAILLLGLWLASSVRAVESGAVAWRTQSAADPKALIARGRAQLDAAAFAGDPGAERELLWWMGHAAVNAADDAALTEVVARLDSLGSAGYDEIALAYAGFLRADRKIVRGDGGGVSEALVAATRLQSHSSPALRALARFQLCDAYTMAGQPERAQPLCADADAAFAALGDEWNRAQAENNEGAVAFDLGKARDAATFYERARSRYERVGDRSQALMVGDNLARAYLELGRPREAIELSRASLVDERAAGRQSDALNSQGNIARALEALGQHREALELMDSTIAEARRAGLDGQLPDLLATQSALAEAAGEWHGALAALREALKFSEARTAPALRSQETELETRYAAREREMRIRDLERDNQIKDLKLKAAQAENERSDAVARRQRVSLFAAASAVAGLAIAVVLLWLLLRTQRRHACELRRQALQDALTGVDNRRGFFCRMQALLAATPVPATPLHALLLADFDHFKRINDRGGHPFGDLVLSAALQCMQRTLGARGHLARLGGEEFVALCPKLGAEAALALAEELRAAVAAMRFQQGPEQVEVTISIGVALYDGGLAHDASSWLRSADNALYAAKHRGRNRVVAAGDEPEGQPQPPSGGRVQLRSVT